MDWDAVDWSVLGRLRDVFLQRVRNPGPYWEGPADFENYDFTFGRRIAWKWAAVVTELLAAGWTPPARRIVDWGCGTGMASRSLLAHCGGADFSEVVLWDHSVSAARFASDALRARGYALDVSIADPMERDLADGFVLLLSHIINELDDATRASLLDLASRARAVLWVEPGAFAESQALIDARESLRADFHCWMPCPHNAACGLRAPGNERHWCHHFARPPTEVFTEAGWANFSRRLGIDLRSLPYSYLVLDRRAPARLPRGKRVLGRPRESSGVMTILRCQDDGVAEVQLQKRDAKALWKTLEKGRGPNLLAWEEDAQGRIVG